MKTILSSLTVAAVTALVPMSGVADLVTGNPGVWASNDWEAFPSGIFPLTQNITVPASSDPSGLWLAESVTLTSWRPSSSVATGWRVYLAPDHFAHNDPWVDAAPAGANTALGHASFGGPLGVDDTAWPGPITGATTDTANFDTPFQLAPGLYHLQIEPIGAVVNLARDNAANTYAGGEEGYFQPAGPSVGINANHDLVFSVSGTPIPEPSMIGLLACGGLLLGLRSRQQG